MCLNVQNLDASIKFMKYSNNAYTNHTPDIYLRGKALGYILWMATCKEFSQLYFQSVLVQFLWKYC